MTRQNNCFLLPVLLICLSACHSAYPDFSREFVYMDDEQSIIDSFKGLHRFDGEVRGGESGEEYNKRVGHYHPLVYFSDNPIKSLAKTVYIKERPYYIGLYFNQNYKNITGLMEGMTSSLSEISENNLTLDDFFKCQNYTNKSKPQYLIDNYVLTRLIRIVDIYDENHQKLCSSYYPYSYIVLDNIVQWFGIYNMYNTFINYERCCDSQHKFVILYDENNISSKYLNEHYHKNYGSYSLLSTCLEIDDNGFCYLPSFYASKLGENIDYRIIDKKMSYKKLDENNEIVEYHQTVQYYVYSISDVENFLKQ